MRTLSARILLGFAALTLAFGGVTINIVLNQRTLAGYVATLNTGLLPVAETTKDLARREEELRQFLADGFDKDASIEAAKLRLSGFRQRRDKEIAVLQKFFAEYPDIDALDGKRTLRQLNDGIANKVDLLKPHYDNLELQLRQTDRLTSDTVNAALGPLRDGERALSSDTNNLSNRVQGRVKDSLAFLQKGEKQSLGFTIFLGAVAVVLGLTMTMWVMITLRPLRRLQNAARLVAAGDYGSRIEEKGPSEVKDLARELNTMARAVEERERELVRSERLAAVGKMAAMITHEVRNPLSSIGLNTELLDDELGDASQEARDLCRAIHREVDRLTAITEEYLTFARLPKPKIQPEAINPMVGALAAFVRGDLAAKKVELAVDLGEPDPIALVDAGQIRQCLINLVRNASEALSVKGGGTVTLRTRRAGDRITISVEDNGVGIAADVLPRLFDPFFSTKEGGSGLGLALTQQIVKDHGGDLLVESVVGKGTTFTVSVPAKP